MGKLLDSAVNGWKITDEDIADDLYEICVRVHASCGSECPVYKKNKGAVGADKPFDENRGCDCFKNGKAMLEFLRKS